jgi:hypothetical protein
LALNVQKGTITAPAAVGSVTYPLPAGFDPKAIILWTTGQTADGVTDASALFSIGAATYDGSVVQQWYSTVWSQDNNATSETCRGTNVNACLKGYSGFATTTVTVDFIVTFTNFGSGASSGFTLNWTDIPATAGVLVHYMVLGGSDLAKARCGSTTISTAATLAVTVATGWGQPDLLLFSSTRAGSNADVTSEIGQGIGWAKSDTERYCSSVFVADAAATVTCGSFMAARATAVLTTAPGIDGYSDLGARTAWPVDGFQFNNLDVYGGNRVCLWLALQGTFLSSVQNGPAPTVAAPATQAFSLPSGTVKGAFLWGNGVPANAAVDTTHNDLFGRFVGGTDGTNHGVAGHTEDDNNATSTTSNFSSRTKAVQHYVADAAGGPSTLASEADVTLSGSTLTLNWNDTDTVARDFGVVLLGDSTTGGGPATYTGTAAVSLEALTAAAAGTFASTARTGSVAAALSELACTGAGTFAFSDTQAATVFPFAVDAEGWAGTPAANSTTTYDGTAGNPAGSLKTRIAGRNKGPELSYWEWSGTWEALGVPAGRLATGITGSLDYSCTEYNVGAASTAGPLELYDNAGTLLATLVVADSFSATTAWVPLSGAHATVPAASQASTSIIRLRVGATLATGANNAAAASVQFDNVTVIVDHAAPSFTGTATPALPEVTSTAAGTSTAPAFTGSAADSLDALTQAAAGTFAVPTRAATGSALLEALTPVAAGTFTAPVYSATTANSLSVLATAAGGTHAVPTFTGAAADALSALSSAAAGTHTAPVYAATSAAGLPALTSTATGTVVNPTYRATSAVTLGTPAAAGAGVFAVGVFSGTSAASLTSLTTAAAGTFTVPTYSATSAPTVGPLAAAVAGTHAVPTYSGTSAAPLQAVATGAAGTSTRPVYSGTSSPGLSVFTTAAAGTHAAPVYSGTAAAPLSALAASGAGVYATVVYSGASAGSLSVLTTAGSGMYALPAATGTGPTGLPALVSAASGTRTAPAYTGTSGAGVQALASAGIGLYTVVVYQGTSALMLPGIGAGATGAHAGPVYAAVCAAALPAALSDATGASTSPQYLASAQTVLAPLSTVMGGRFTTWTPPTVFYDLSVSLVRTWQADTPIARSASAVVTTMRVVFWELPVLETR